eukprot:gene20597-22628_t
MALKLLGIVFLLVAAIYAAPSSKNEVEPFEMDEAEALDDPMEEDPEEIEQDEDDEDELEEDAKSKSKYRQLFGNHLYCLCKKPAKPAAGDSEHRDEEMSMQDVEEHVAALSDAASSKGKMTKKKFNSYIKKLVNPFFARTKLDCFCSKNKAVVRLMRYLNTAAIVAHKQKIAFAKHVKALIVAVHKQKKSG